MVRTKCRRTRTDLERLADAVDANGAFARLDTDAEADARIDRFRSHGWVSGDSLTADGEQIAQVVAELSRKDELAWVVDIFGVPAFVDEARRAPTYDGAVDTFARVLSAANLCDEARHQAGTQDVEPDHDGLFAPHIDGVDTSTGSVDLTFDDADTAAEFVDLWNGDFRTTAAVRTAADPKRVVLGAV